ncbi:hypothetical protein ACI2K4_18990 [Micromonospora sp. NPDC050397]|uniref:hypothetical protein n=1 Tax=Micromonospora sp. NPDC050397 TaxID=3364279 RepID=UPI00384C4E75
MTTSHLRATGPPKEPTPETPTPTPPHRFRRGPLADVAALLSYFGLTVWITAGLWLRPGSGVRENEADQAFFEWMLAHGARVVSRGDYPFWSDRMNVPDGLNIMANTSVLGVSVPLAPVTLLCGPRIAFNVFLTLALLATATTWYLVLSRHLVRHRGAAWVGALFCAYAPAMVSHANGHPNIVGQFMVPLIVWRVLRLREPGRWPRNGLLLGLLIVWQGLINLEILLMTAVGLGVVLAVVVARRPELRYAAGTFLAGLGLAAGVALILLGYPLYVQLFGPQSYSGLPRSIRAYGADLASYVTFPGQSLAGDRSTAARLAQNASEQNAYLGWPLVVLVVALVWWLRRSAVVLGLAAAGLLFAVMSLGPRIHWRGRDTGIPSVWAVLEDVPLLDSAVPTRWALAIVPIIGLLLALGCARAAELARGHPAAADPVARVSDARVSDARVNDARVNDARVNDARVNDAHVPGHDRTGVRFATGTVLVMALLPITPLPVPVERLPPTPAFVTAGTWRQYVAGGRSLVALPLPASTYPDPLRWSAETGLDLPLARGYFLGPDTRPGRPEGRVALFSAPPTPTSRFFDAIARTGTVPRVDQRRRTEALTDLRSWRAGVVVLAPQRRADALRAGMVALTGIEPTLTGGVWIWDVRPLLTT